MATTTTSVKSYSDDLSDGASLKSSERVGIRVSDGASVWYIDTARANEIVSTLKAAGVKQKKRGRKAQASA